VPAASLLSNETTNFVWVVVDNAVAMRPVSLLAESGDMAAVSGLGAGSQVVLNPAPGLLDGTRVRIVTPDSAKAGSR